MATVTNTTTTNYALPGTRRVCDPGIAERRRLCCAIFGVISGVAGIAIIVVGAVLGLVYLTGPGITLIVWGVICGSAAYRYGYFLRQGNQTQNVAVVHTNLPSNLRQPTPVPTGLNQPNIYGQPQPDVNMPPTQPYFGQYATQYSSPNTFTQPGGNMPPPPPSYESTIGYKAEK